MKKQRSRHCSAHRLLRTRLAHEAAKWIVDNGLHDYSIARRKIAKRHKIKDPVLLPRDFEMIDALLQYRRLFSRPEDDIALHRQRTAALEAMLFFEPFHPRLVGPVLEKTAAPHTPIELHLHTNDADAVQRFLEDNHISARLGSQYIYLGRSQRQNVLVWHLCANGWTFHIVVLPEAALRHAPLSTDERRPITRASTRQLSALLAQSEGNQTHQPAN